MSSVSGLRPLPTHPIAAVYRAVSPFPSLNLVCLAHVGYLEDFFTVCPDRQVSLFLCPKDSFLLLPLLDIPDLQLCTRQTESLNFSSESVYSAVFSVPADGIVFQQPTRLETLEAF